MYTPSPIWAFATQSGANFKLKSFDTSTFITILRLVSAFLRCALAFDPDFAVSKNFFLPDRHSAFQLANGPFASLEGCVTMRRADGDHDARFANLEASCAMNDADVRNVKTLMCFAA